jgi:hypothetical protein
MLDDTDPTVISIAFSGQIKLDRAVASDVELFNRLTEGRTHVWPSRRTSPASRPATAATAKATSTPSWPRRA